MAEQEANYQFDGKVALILDVCNSIGNQLVKLLLTLGCSVAAVSFHKEKSKQLEQDLQPQKDDLKARLEHFVIDKHDDKSVSNVVEKVVSTFKELHFLVNITGTNSEDSIEDFKVEDLDTHFLQIVRTPLLATKYCSAHLVKSKGCIVNVSSIFGYRPFPQTLTYGMAMKTLIHLTSNSANELALQGVRVNAIIPSFVGASSEEKKTQSDPHLRKLQDYNKKCHPLGHLGSIDGYCQALLYLLSDYSSFTTGEVLTVDGGRHVLDRDV